MRNYFLYKATSILSRVCSSGPRSKARVVLSCRRRRRAPTPPTCTFGAAYPMGAALGGGGSWLLARPRSISAPAGIEPARPWGRLGEGQGRGPPPKRRDEPACLPLEVGGVAATGTLPREMGKRCEQRATHAISVIRWGAWKVDWFGFR